jgi:hypothetical protein
LRREQSVTAREQFASRGDTVRAQPMRGRMAMLDLYVRQGHRGWLTCARSCSASRPGCMTTNASAQAASTAAGPPNPPTYPRGCTGTSHGRHRQRNGSRGVGFEAKLPIGEAKCIAPPYALKRYRGGSGMGAGLVPLLPDRGVQTRTCFPMVAPRTARRLSAP